MKMIFEFQETVTYTHSIEVEIPEEKEEEYEEFADGVADKMASGGYGCDRDRIISDFNKKFGRESVDFCEDGSPDVEFEAI